MKGNIKISIIIPAFNAENYINRCINSLLQQDIPQSEYEIIVVNDGSKDQTSSVLSDIAQNTPCLKYINTANQGVSMARNRGIEEAVGEYLLFIDADDTIIPNALGRIFSKMETGKLDLLQMEYNYYNSKGQQMESFDPELKKCQQDIVSGKDFIRRGYLPSVVCAIAYRRSLLIEKKLRFVPIRHEDEEFLPRVIYFAERIEYWPFAFYNYIQNSESFMLNYNTIGFFDKIKGMDSLNKFKKNFIMESDIRFLLEENIAYKLMESFKLSFHWKTSIQTELVKQMKDCGLTPLKSNKGLFHKVLYRFFPGIFIDYYRRKALKKQLPSNVSFNNSK